MRKRMGLKCMLLTVGVALVSLGLTLSPVIAAAPAPATIKIGSVIALTGRFAAGGKDVKPGYDLAV